MHSYASPYSNHINAARIQLRLTLGHKITPAGLSEISHEHNHQMYPDLIGMNAGTRREPITSCNPSQSTNTYIDNNISYKEITEENDDPEHIEKHETTELPMDPKLSHKLYKGIPYIELSPDKLSSYRLSPDQLSSYRLRIAFWTQFSCHGAQV